MMRRSDDGKDFERVEGILGTRHDGFFQVKMVNFLSSY